MASSICVEWGGGQGGFCFFSASLGEKLKYFGADSLGQSPAR